MFTWYGQLGDDDRHPVATGLLEGDLGPHDDPAVAVGVHLADRVDRLVRAGDRVRLLLVAEDRAAGREVGALDVAAQVVGGELRVVDEGDLGVDDLAEVVRRDVRGHPDRDPGRAVDEEVRELRRQDRRLAVLAVVVVGVVDRGPVDVGEHLGRDRRQARLRVAHRRGRVAVDRAEVALPVDERVAHREVLRQPDEGVVDRRVAVGMELAHDLADDRRALAVRARRREPHLPHRVEDPAVDRLEAVADVGQGAGHDHAHRVVEVRRPHLVLDADRADVAQVVGHGRVLRCVDGGTAGHVRGTSGSGRPRPAEVKAAAVAAALDVDGAPGVRRIAGERRADRIGVGGGELRERVAEDPGPVAVLGSSRPVPPRPGRRRRRAPGRPSRARAAPTRAPSGRRARRRRSAGRRGRGRGRRPRRYARDGGPTCGRSAIVEPTSRRSQRIGLKTSCSSSAQRYGSPRIPAAATPASVSTVIQSSASRPMRRMHLPGPLRIVRRGSSGGRGSPSSAARGSRRGRARRRRRGGAPGGRRAPRGGARRRPPSRSGVRMPSVGPIPGRDEPLPVATGRIREGGEVGRGRAPRRRRDRRSGRRGAPRSAGRRAAARRRGLGPPP